jgi:predicted O-methyltransferase YrrM
MTTSAPATQTTWTYRSSDDPVMRALPNRLTTALLAHADQKPRERVLLYSLVFAFAPQRCLEIGVRWGGGSRIIHAALSDLNQGVLVGIDPAPALEFDWSTIADRAHLITGSSPAALPQAADLAGGLFDFVFIDGDHSEKGCRGDLEGVIPFTTPGAIILLHDAYHPPVARAIDAVLNSGAPLTDCGFLATTLNNGTHVESGRTVPYGGVRMLRKR